MNNIEIAVVGHDPKSFPVLTNPILKPAILPNLNFDKEIYKNNSLAESRFFLCNDFFSEQSNIVGCLTASWDKKYFPNKLNDFNQWPIYKHLQSSNANSCITNIVGCATLCFGKSCRMGAPLWEKNFQQHFRKSWKNSEWIESKIYKITGLKYNGMSPAPYSNQIICNKIIFYKYCDFIKSIIDNIIDVFGLFPKIEGTAKEIDTNRSLAYVMEEVSMLWWANQPNIVFIQCGKIKPGWYK